MSFVILSDGVLLVHDQKVICIMSIAEWTALNAPVAPLVPVLKKRKS